MNKRFTIIMLLMAFFMPWTAKAQETKTIQVAPDRGSDRGNMTVYKRVSSLYSGRNYLIVSSATANSDALALSQTSSTDENITAAFVHINSGISATGNAAYIANLADPTAVWRATSSSDGWTFSHTKNGTTYYIYCDRSLLGSVTFNVNTSSSNWNYSNNTLYYHYSILWSSTDYYITPSSSGFDIGTDVANVYLFEETSVTAYDVTASVSPSGIGRVTGAGQYPAGATCTLTASTFDSEYAFSNWTVNGTVVSTNPTYSFTVNADQNVVANFESIVTCPSPTNLTAGTPYGHSVPLNWASSTDNFNVRYRTIGSGETQTFFDGFENGLGNWTVIRNGGGDDSSGTDWAQNSPNFSSGNVSPHTGTYVAMSRSWNSSAYSVDNWLITPQVTLDGILKFWVLDDGRYHEHYDVYVSTTGNSITDFTLYYEPGNASDTWTQVTVDLSSFNGVSGYIALRHTDTDQDYLLIDDFGIYAQRYGDWSELIPVEGTSYTLTGLESQTQYQVQVQANCGDEQSGWSNRVNFTTTAPSTAAPTNLTVDANSITNNSATVSWQGVAANDTHQYYQLYYAESDVTSVPSSPAAPNLIDSITETSYTLTGLDPETGYHVWVRDYCGEDGYSPWTSYITFTTLVSCPRPIDLTVSDITPHGATIEWTGVGDSYQYYQMYFAESNVTYVPDSLVEPNFIDSITEASYILTGLTSETEYHVWVRGYCGEDDYSAWTSYQTFTTLVSCPRPTDLTASDITAHSATIEWNSIGDNYQYYQIYYAESDVTSVPDSLAAPNFIDSISETSYTLSGLHSDRAYHVWVRAYCGEYDGYSVWTSYLSFTTPESCLQPSNVTVTNETAHGATIEWNGTSDSYLVMVGETGQSTTYSFDFEDGTSQGWTVLKGNEGTSPNNWMHSSAYSAYDSNQALIVPVCHNSSSGMMLSESYISAASAGATPYGAVYPDNYLVSPQIRLGGSITFYAASRMENYPAEKFSVLVSETGNTSVSDFTHTVMTVTLTDNSWNVFNVDLSAYSGLGYVAIRHYDCYDQHLLYVDDITIESGATATTWMTYEAEESPFVLYDVENIHPESTYSVQVIGICDDEESRPSATTSFTTPIACLAPTDLAIVENSINGHGATFTWTGYSDSYIVKYRTPAYIDGISEEFNSSSVPTDWTRYSGLVNNVIAGTATLTETTSGWTTNSYALGAYNMKVNIWGTSCNYWLVTPEITIGNDLDFGLSFDMALTDYANSNPIEDPTAQADDRFVVLVYVNNAWQILREWNNSGSANVYNNISSTGENVNIDLSAYQGRTIKIAFYGESTASGGDNDLHIDNVTLGALVPAGEWQTVTTDTTYFALTGLTPETLYEVVVQGDCGVDGLSAESNYVTFTTDISCPAPTPLDATEVTSNSAVLNWTGDAESYNVSYYKTFFFENFEEDLSQWTIYKEGDEASWEWAIENPHDNSADLNAHSGNYAVVSYSDYDVHADSWLVSPQIQFPNQTMLKFWIMRYTYDDALDEYEVRLSTTGNAIEDFDIVLKEKETANPAWTEVSIDLSEYDGQQGYIAIRHDYTDGFFIMVDDFGIFGWSEEITTTDNSLLIEDLLPETEYLWKVQANCGEEDGLSQWASGSFTTLPPCPVPFDLNVTEETAYGATIAWTGFSESYNVWVGQYETRLTGYDFEDQDISDFTTTTTDYSWTVTSNDKHDGTYSVKSGGAGTASVTSDLNLEVNVEYDATLSFWARISSESSYDKGYFSIDGVAQSDLSGISGNGSWINYTYTLEAGSHTLRWYYSKDTSVNSNDDCFYVDDITIESEILLSEMNYTATESPFILNDATNILPETTYTVKVKGFCGDQETEYSESVTFTTLDENTKIFVIEGDWNDGDNWVPAGVPSIDENVILRAEATVFDVAEANAITIEGTGVLIIEDGGQLKTNADVEATMKKFIIGYGTDYVETDNGYYLMTLPTAAPVAAADAGLITEESDFDLYSWDRTATDEEWQNNHDGIDLQNGVGFLYANRDDMEMSFTATLRNSGEPVVVTPAFDDVEHGGWNLCANPFPCEAYITTDAEGMTFYRLVDNELVPIEGAIAPLEAFFVNVTAAGQTFTISREAPAK